MDCQTMFSHRRIKLIFLTSIVLILLIIVVIVFAIMSGQHQSQSISPTVSVLDFWPQVKKDLTQVTWAHAVNSKDKLEKALKDGKLTDLILNLKDRLFYKNLL